MDRKRLLTLAVIGFAVFFIVTKPVEAATILRQGAEGTARIASGAAEAFSTFLTTLF
jgi:cell shape-determining protein MreC